MRKLVVAGMFFSIALFSVSQDKVGADALDLALAGNEELQTQTIIKAIDTSVSDTVVLSVDMDLEEPEQSTLESKVLEYVIQKGDSLSKIASLHGTTWQRIYDKNVKLEDPDHLLPGVVLTIPNSDEVLEARIQPVDIPARAASSQSSAPRARVSAATPRGSSDGNRYVAGYCTWYVKNRRPDLPNNLGNAATWVSRAAAQGLATGSTPATGAVGQKGNHVVYVESVNGDGTINISDMNYQALYVVTHRTVPANQFSYIY